MPHPFQAPDAIALAAGTAGWMAIVALCWWRARRSRYPSLLWTCAAYMTLLHAVWLTGLVTGRMLDNSFGLVVLLTFPWSMAGILRITMAGMRTAPDLLLNYARFILGFGGLQCLMLTLFIWELRPRPRRARL